VNYVESEEYRELKAEIENIKEQIVKLKKELLNVKRLACMHLFKLDAS